MRETILVNPSATAARKAARRHFLRAILSGPNLYAASGVTHTHGDIQIAVDEPMEDQLWITAKRGRLVVTSAIGGGFENHPAIKRMGAVCAVEE